MAIWKTLFLNTVQCISLLAQMNAKLKLRLRVLDFRNLLNIEVVKQYSAALSGSLGRLIFSLGYFVLLANTMSLEAFGIFATVSATGVMLSRVVGFGFVSPLYRAATLKPLLLGVYSAGFFAAALLSLPILLLLSGGVFWLIFSGQIDWWPFVLILVAEALFWRLAEVVIIVNYGLKRFARGSFLTILGTAIRALAAFGFWYAGFSQLDHWAWFYLIANFASLIIAAVWFFPWRKFSWKPVLYRARLADAANVSVAEMLFYMQMELDKIVVLLVGGAQLSGAYAIVMRLADLTAIPIRTFNMMLVQKLMRTPMWLGSMVKRLFIELGIFLVSLGGMVFLGGLLWFKPDLLGQTVATISSLVLLALAVPGFRNIIEYHAELLYARGQTGLRSINLGVLALSKGAVLGVILAYANNAADLIVWLNFGFLILYVFSFSLTSFALRRPPKTK